MANELTSSATSGSTATVTATIRLVLLTSAATSGSTATVTATVTTRRLTSSALSGSIAAVVGAIRRALLTSRSTSGSRASVTATLTTSFVPKVNVTSTGLSRRAIFSQSGGALTVKDVLQHIFSIWGRSACTDCQDNEVQRDAVACLNHALQTLYSNARRLDWFSREELSVTVTGGTNSITLAQAVQTVLGPVRLVESASEKLPLQELRRQCDFDAFVDLAYGGSAYAPERPRAYMLSSARQTNEDGVALTLYVTPTPADDADLAVDVVKEPERYSWSDVRNGTRLRVPHKYVESLLIPVALKWASRYRHFTRREMQPQLDESYATAQVALGLVSTETPAATAEKQPTNPSPSR